MGNYTGLVMAAELKKDTPQDVIDVLKALCGDIALEDLNLRSIVLDDLSFFKTERWHIVLRCDSYYVTGTSASNLVYDEATEKHALTVRSNLKNYDDEIGMFLEWLAPYCTDGEHFNEFVGYKLSDGADSEPVLIYFGKGKVKYHYVNSGLLNE